MENYLVELRHKEGCSTLVVALSHKDTFAFYKQPINHSVLFVVDKASTYYCHKAAELAAHIRDLVAKYRFEDVLFIGLSKGAYGSLLLSALCAALVGRCRFRAVAFSAPSRVYPFNDRLPFPSYKAMISRSQGNDGLRRDLEMFGDVKEHVSKENLLWVMVYGEGSRLDAGEASLLVAPNIRKYPIPFSFHGSSIPFCMERTNIEMVRREVKIIFDGAAKEADLAATLPSSQEDLVSQLLAAKWLPTFSEIIDQTLALRM